MSAEIEDTRFAVPGSQCKYHEGTLQDLLRVRRLIKDGEHFASEIIRLSGRSLTIGGNNEMPPFIVFDGAAGFVRWHSQLRSSNWIVVLDRTDSRFREAADVLNDAYLNRTLEERQIVVPALPEGIEAMTFYERW